jgi:hypothetical protein
MILAHWPEPQQLGPRSPDRCDVFPVALGVEAIYLNRRGSMKLMLCAAIGTPHWMDGRSYRPGPSKQQPRSARAIHHSLLRSWHQGGASDLREWFYARSKPGVCSWLLPMSLWRVCLTGQQVVDARLFGTSVDQRVFIGHSCCGCGRPEFRFVVSPIVLIHPHL